MSGFSVCIVGEAFDPEAELAGFRAAADGAGAIVSMIGVARGALVDGTEVKAVVVHHYPGFTELHVEKLIGEACHRWSVEAVHVLHRVGEIEPSEAIVLVAVAARHRREAFAGVEYVMDGLKTSAPFWKQEVRAGGMVWIAPRIEDHADAARWKVSGMSDAPGNGEVDIQS